jgi:hypothetical protein
MGAIGEGYESGLVLGQQSTHGRQGYPWPKTRGSSDRPVGLVQWKGAIYAINLWPFRPHVPAYLSSERWDMKLSALRYEIFRA